jgi:IclR family acetate operon transcriptional repressor
LIRREADVKLNYRVAAVDKALDILEFLSRQRREFGLRDLSQALNMPKATLFRYLVTLERRGYVRKDSGNEKYWLGFRILELSNCVLGNMTLHEVALPYMQEILDRFRETVNLAVLEGDEVVYIEILESPQSFKMSSHVGGRDYPHATSVGKAMLAFLPEKEVERIVHATGLPKRTDKTITSHGRLKEELAMIRQRGYAIDNGENEEGARCVGAPIFDHRGGVVAAVSVSGPAFRTSMKEIEELGLALLDVTSQISQKMGYVEQPSRLDGGGGMGARR